MRHSASMSFKHATFDTCRLPGSLIRFKSVTVNTDRIEINVEREALRCADTLGRTLANDVVPFMNDVHVSQNIYMIGKLITSFCEISRRYLDVKWNSSSNAIVLCVSVYTSYQMGVFEREAAKRQFLDSMPLNMGSPFGYLLLITAST